MRRISSNLQHNDTQFALRRQESRINEVNNQISGQRKILNLRDDPLAAGHSVRYQSYLSRLERFEKNAKTVKDQYSITEGYMNQSLQVMHRLKELTVSAATGTNTPADLKNMVAEVDEILKELVANGNAIGPDGTYLFSGTKSFTLPFEAVYGDVDGAGNPMIMQVRYNGSLGEKGIEIDEQSYIQTNQPGSRTFWAEPQSLFSEVNATEYMVPADTTVEIDGITVNLYAGDNVYAIISRINDSGAAVKATLDPVTQALNLQTTDARQLWLRDGEGGTVLSSLGLVRPDQRPPNNIAPSVRLSGGSLYDAVISLRDSLISGDQEAIGSRILGSIDSATDNLTVRLAEIGARYNRSQMTLARLDTQILNVSAAESREGDIDFTKAITDLKMYEYTQQAALSVAGKLYSNTLLNYIR
ncbi:flagellar hook-associated protein 3 [Brucepastera parasyntrophica]|uniref:flagellar hook-associated protein 3 n=1 Tax=Brucepastera parasyntrophica TaxID=2880008 RepID=UPI0021096250|nr:flagellar hook-associated protein 3 [Brucepastera parasyntrophica]ULQ59752.1 flagellar hook-associated protein 3 [Brucepastera parasyntrophica]